MSPESKTFTYVKYDQEAIDKQEAFKAKVEDLETMVHSLGAGRPQSLACTKLEEFYMWVGKAIRDEQYRRIPQTPHQPERGE